MTVPAWAWVAFAAFVLGVLMLDLFVLHRNEREISIREAGLWSVGWTVLALAFGAVLWLVRGAETGQAYLAGYLIERSLSLDNVFVFAIIFGTLAIPPRYQHRVLMAGIVGALVMRAAFLIAGAAALSAFHAVSYVFAALLLVAAVRMFRGQDDGAGGARWMNAVSRVVPATSTLHGQRFVVRRGGRFLITPLLVAVLMIETADLIFAIDSVPSILAITTDTFVLYTSNVFAILGLRSLYFLLAGAAVRVRYLQPGLAVILVGVAAKLVIGDSLAIPMWVSPAFIAAVLAAVAIMSMLDARRQRSTRQLQPAVGGVRPAPVRREAEYSGAAHTVTGSHE
jgi:tellurite resistance protein TerC